MVYSIENCYGKFNLKKCYDCETNETFYDVYIVNNEEEIYGDYLGEFHTEFSFDDMENTEYVRSCIKDFEKWCVENI